MLRIIWQSRFILQEVIPRIGLRRALRAESASLVQLPRIVSGLVMVPDGATIGRIQNLDDALRGLLGRELIRFVECLDVLVPPFRHSNVVEVILRNNSEFWLVITRINTLYLDRSLHSIAAVTKNPYSVDVVMHLVTRASREGHNTCSNILKKQLVFVVR